MYLYIISENDTPVQIFLIRLNNRVFTDEQVTGCFQVRYFHIAAEGIKMSFLILI